MKKMYELRDMLCEELDKLTDKGQVTSGSLELIEKRTASIHYIDEIMQMEDGGYSNGYSNARGRGRGANRDSMGRYSSNDGYSSRMMSYDYSRDGYANDYSRDGYANDYSRDYSRDGYSRDSKHMVHQLRSMLQDTQDPETKKAIERCINQIEG